MINATASAINEGRDLSARIGLLPGYGEFSRLAGNFDRMLERLERPLRRKKQFTADASHELRTPVSVILGACEYAENMTRRPRSGERPSRRFTGRERRWQL
ncbi:MAG: histidine kinase dimerization/phospho-acceptor domain-containing protein [Oscillospiraceae bacterium]